MASQLNLSTLVKFYSELMAMLPGEDRDFQLPGRRPIRVHCMDGVYQPSNALFYIHSVRVDGDQTPPWRNVDQTAFGLCYLLAV